MATWCSPPPRSLTLFAPRTFSLLTDPSGGWLSTPTNPSRNTAGSVHLAGQKAPTHQEFVGLPGRLATFGDGPDDERSPSLGVAGHEEAGLAGAEAVLGADGAAVGVAEVHLLHKAVAHGAREADGEEDEIGLHLEVGALYGDGPAVRGALRFDGVHRFDVAVAAGEARDGDGEAALAALLVGGVGMQDERPVGPGEVVWILGRLRAVGE